ncbi:MAG: chemotaxis protein CheW [Pseudomonadota bacterium]
MVIRGAYVPLVYLHRHFDIAGAVDDPCQGIVVIVESETEGRIGLVVDELLGQQQVVVKSLEVNYQPVVGVSGATILGSGRVALILDVTALRGTEGSAARSVTASPSENAASRPH